MATLQFSEGGRDPPKPLHRRRQLLPNIVDGMARIRPEALYAETPASYSSYEGGYRKVTYSDLANAVNGVAWLLMEQLGPGKNFETLAYVGPNDLSYPTVILGAIKAGYKILSISPRNSVQDHTSLFEATQCKTLLTVKPPYSPVAALIQQALSPRTIHVPSLFSLLDGHYEHFPYEKSFATAKDEPVVVVHTSGTTSTPKPITYTHNFVASYGGWHQAEPPTGFQNAVALVQSNRYFVTLPFFHAGCLYASLFDAILNQTTIVTPLTGVPPSAQVIVDGLKLVDVDTLLLAPPFMEQIAKNSTMLDVVCSKVRSISYGGGDVSKACGDAFASRVILFNFNGSTETSSYPALRVKDATVVEDWKYIHPHPSAGMEFRSSVDGLFEAFLVRKSDPEQEQPVFKIFPELQEYRTKDLWSPHPDKSGAWLYRGRADDIIVFMSGYLCNPVTLEQRVSDHQDIRSTLMAGTGRYRPALLLEPESDEWLVSKEAKDNLIQRVWPVIEEANKSYSQESQIRRSHVLVIDSGKPFQRAGKGTVQRAPSMLLYEPELNKLYEDVGDEREGGQAPYKVPVEVN